MYLTQALNPELGIVIANRKSKDKKISTILRYAIFRGRGQKYTVFTKTFVLAAGFGGS